MIHDRLVQRRRWLTRIAVLFLFIAMAIVVLYAARLSRREARLWLDRWSIAEWAVAIGTLSLAGFTLLLAHRVRGQIEIQRLEAEARGRPIVYPVVTDEWSRSGQKLRYLLIRNGGLGPAISVEGEIEWNAPGASVKPRVAVWQSGGLGPGEERLNFLARPGIENWHNARGVLIAVGADRRRWRTDFGCQIEKGDIIVLRVADIREIGPNDPATLPN